MNFIKLVLCVSSFTIFNAALAGASTSSACFTGQLGKLETREDGKVFATTLAGPDPIQTNSVHDVPARTYTLAVRTNSPSGNAMFKLLSLAVAARMNVALKGDAGCRSIKSVTLAVQ